MYYHTDRLGSPVTITDRHGDPVVRYAWDAYGRAMAGVFEPYNTIGFSGKMRDGATGLTYFGARWYDAESGKFLSRDPIRDGWNWYAYVGGDPVNFVDPWGLESKKSNSDISMLGAYGDPFSMPIISNSDVYIKNITKPYDPSGGGQFIAESLRPEHGPLNSLSTGSGFKNVSRIITYRPHGSTSLSNWELEQIKPSSRLQTATGEPLHEWQVVEEPNEAKEFAKNNPTLVSQALEESEPTTGQIILEFFTSIMVPRD
jgi:RHS repeat-associated protein